jgi:hypothetical protein
VPGRPQDEFQERTRAALCDLEDWRRVSEVVDGDLEALVDARVATLENEFTDELLEKVVKAGGLIEKETSND